MKTDALIDMIQSNAISLPSIDHHSFAQKFDFLAQAKLVMLGDGSHGTQEFYSARAEISKYLIENHGFNIIALEASHCDVMHLDQEIRNRKKINDNKPFNHPAPWLWQNQEFYQFIQWLKEWNQYRMIKHQTAIYGLDLQQSKNSISAVSDYLHHINIPVPDMINSLLKTLKNFRDDPQSYLTEQKHIQHEQRTKIANSIYKSINAIKPLKNTVEHTHWLDALLNSLAIVHGTEFDKACLGSFTDRWNAREAYMISALNSIISEAEADAKIIVWAHNSHVGDAEFTEFSWTHHFNSIGQMVKQNPAYSPQVSIGFGTHSGTLWAAREWGMPAEILTIQEPLPDSWEFVSHAVGKEHFLLDLTKMRTSNSVKKPYRSFGTYYTPEKEQEQCYFETELMRQFDYWIWFDKTSALIPCHE